MKAVFRVGLATLAFLVLWAVVVFVGTSGGWWKQTLAPRGDIAGFLDAAAKIVDSSNRGNAVFALIDDGSVHGVHAVSVGEAADVNTVFQTASLSKWITAWGVMALVQEGKLDLDAPVSTYLTRWKLPESKFDNNKVTVRRLLSHTAGLIDGLGYAGFAPNAPVQSLEESLKRPADVSPGKSGTIAVGYEPGSEWRYSGGGYAILQLLIEEVSGESFESYMQRVVFHPLGMVRSTFDWTPTETATLATFYDPTPNRRLIIAFRPLRLRRCTRRCPTSRGLFRPSVLERTESRSAAASFRRQPSPRCGGRTHPSSRKTSGVLARSCTPATTGVAS